jgi:small ubiquitin-related modifier
MSPPPEDRRAKPEPDPMIKLKVKDNDGRRVFHTMRMSDNLQAVMNAYYAKAPDVTYGSGTFMLDGIRLKGSKTAADLDLNGDDYDDELVIEIDFFEDQVGGGRDGA